MELDPQIKKRYDRILAKLHDFAVTHITDEVCHGCHSRIPPQAAVEVRKNDTISRAKPVDGFSSTMSRELKDAERAKKLARAIEALARGQSLERAAAYAALEKRLLVKFLESVKTWVEEAPRAGSPIREESREKSRERRRRELEENGRVEAHRIHDGHRGKPRRLRVRGDHSRREE